MKFVLVNGRSPRPERSCQLCCEPIGKSYLREVATRNTYCSYECYLTHYKVAPHLIGMDEDELRRQIAAPGKLADN
jgi:hypothetical protein